MYAFLGTARFVLFATLHDRYSFLGNHTIVNVAFISSNPPHFTTTHSFHDFKFGAYMGCDVLYPLVLEFKASANMYLFSKNEIYVYVNYNKIKCIRKKWQVGN